MGIEDIKDEVNTMDSKEFHIANLSYDKLRELKRVEAELSEKFGADLVLIAWQKN
ncbi:hypothetical protein [Turicibacter sanguinis]